jgi:hypothetical protein
MNLLLVAHDFVLDLGVCPAMLTQQTPPVVLLTPPTTLAT